MAGGRIRELFNKYGKVAIGVHFSVSTVSIAGFYVAIKNNVDVESVFEKFGIGVSTQEEVDQKQKIPQTKTNGEMIDLSGEGSVPVKTRNRTAELVASSGGALAMAFLCNKALFPVRVPITIALTPPISKFLARRKIFKNSV